MNDTELDELLSAEGRRFQREQDARPHVDWDLVTAAGDPRRRWLPAAVLAAVAVVGVAVAVPLALTGHRSGTARPAPADRPAPEPRTSGAPAYFLAIRDGQVTQVDARTGVGTGSSVRQAAPMGPVTGLAVTGDGRIGYAAQTAPGCRILVVRYFWKTPYTMTGTPAARIDGAALKAIAISPDGEHLAVGVTECPTPSTASARSSDDIVVVNLRTHAQHRWSGSAAGVATVSTLRWGPDSRTLAYTWMPCCSHSADMVRMLDTVKRGQTYAAPLIVWPAPVHPGVSVGPVFWFGDTLAERVGTTIRARTVDGKLAATLATGLPINTVDIDVDSSGRHLLITTSEGSLFRWDAGALTRIPGQWADAGW